VRHRKIIAAAALLPHVGGDPESGCGIDRHHDLDDALLPALEAGEHDEFGSALGHARA
jgi:hypothetical protein